MFKILRTDSENTQFLELVDQLNSDLAVRDGQDRVFYNQFNKLDAIKHVIIVFEDKIPAGCGAIKEFSADTMEVKRMFTPLQFRSRGIASLVLAELEKWALELGYTKCTLETGKRQPEAIALYKKNGYKIIPNYAQYIGIENSVCFLKELDNRKNSDIK
ncbi:MAG TPA: GNAT family N-acetyltransferase [Ignavibacteria bacterium]|nr:GNAT family N-acetyltransferase [Bacteroidota bacterium]HRE09945.1 GNAT family N-acetyltransferase [Ignavibacteria bacterium]HRF66984.1 GNAT family N-acetyltransferase [Ignavibacteria bacterium]HRJ04800.1 GNAT family N-acetyltransferase [Ignavibacteria bacterium]HRJ85959.1 GNAT family N-acetyltransferase [Ignavibacteria bacterium]